MWFAVGVGVGLLVCLATAGWWWIEVGSRAAAHAAGARTDAARFPANPRPRLDAGLSTDRSQTLGRESHAMRKELTSPDQRAMARQMRDHHWRFADRVAAATGPTWLCWWNKNRHHDTAKAPADLVICGLIDGMELLGWLNSHPDWWIIGEWSAERYAAPVQLTDIGRAALQNRELYDMEPVTGGLVEPGWTCIPAERQI